MKKLLCFLLCLTLIFSSVSLSFAAAADWSTSDQQNLQNVAGRLFYMNQSAAYYLYQIYSRLGTISNTITDIKNALFDDGDSIAYLTSVISSWMNPIYLRLQDILQATTDPMLNGISSLLGYPSTDSSSGVTTWYSYLGDLSYSLTNKYKGSTSWTSDMKMLNAHADLIATSNGQYNMFYASPGGNVDRGYGRWQVGTPLGNIARILRESMYNDTYIYTYLYDEGLDGYNNAQTFSTWLGDQISTSSFTPSSSTNGIYTWLSKIQEPVARLSYVLASDERIEAQEAAAANEEAVVDNFIDSSGDGASSPSDISSVSGLSSGYKQNFATDASPSGIFDIFNSDHATWFSQETKNQLDTTTPSRMTKGSMSETPLLDKQIEDIYDALGVKQP